jgi:hypothetical protein
MTTIHKFQTSPSITDMNPIVHQQINIKTTPPTKTELHKNQGNIAMKTPNIIVTELNLRSKSPETAVYNTPPPARKATPVNIGYVDEYLMNMSAANPCREEFKHAMYKAWLKEDSYEKGDEFGFLSTHGSPSSRSPRRTPSPIPINPSFRSTKNASTSTPASIELANCSRHWKHQNEMINTGDPNLR